MRGSLTLAASLVTLSTFTLAFPQPVQIYGVNLGSWYVAQGSPVLEGLVTDPTQAVDRTMDAPRWCVVGYLPPSLTPHTNSQSEWLSMGGEICTNCQDCIASELYVGYNYPQQSEIRDSNSSTASSPRRTRTLPTKSLISIGKPGSPRPTFNV